MKKNPFEEAMLERILFDSDVITDSSMSNEETSGNGDGGNNTDLWQ